MNLELFWRHNPPKSGEVMTDIATDVEDDVMLKLTRVVLEVGIASDVEAVLLVRLRRRNVAV